ncbi:alpha/beta hydrolase fold domain-containing protein [Vandammella animalimorsus]
MPSDTPLPSAAALDELPGQPWWPQLTPPMRAIVTGMARAQRAPLHMLTPQQARQAYRSGAQVLEEDRPAQVQHRDAHIPARDGHALAVRLYTPQAQSGPAAAPWPVLLYLHGGGFVVGDLDTHDVLCARIAHNAQLAVLALDYRLAPQWRFPTALHDGWDALCWLTRHGAQWGLDGQRLAVGGDSAGGTLAAVLALMARDAALPLQAQLLIHPGTSAWQDTASHQRHARGPVLSAALLQWFFAHYIEPAQRQDWRFAPLLAPEVQAVAPALFVLAECDPLCDEALAYADRLRMQAVPVELELYRGVAHEFIKMGRLLPEAAWAHAAIGQFLRARLQA